MKKNFFGFLLRLHVARFWFPLRETAVFIFNRGFAGSPTGEFSWLRPPGGDREFLSFSSSLLFPRRRDFYRKNKSNFYDHVLCDHIFFRFPDGRGERKSVSEDFLDRSALYAKDTWP